MKAMVLHDREKPFRLEERPEPRAGMGEAVMRVRAAGVGLTLVNTRLGRMGGSRHSTRTELNETMEIMARGLVEPVVGMRVPFEEVGTVFDALRSETLPGRGALTYP